MTLPPITTTLIEKATTDIRFGTTASDTPPTGTAGALAVDDTSALDRLLRRAFQLSRTLLDALFQVF